MDSEITTRLAVTEVDFEEMTLPTIYRIFESEVGGSINRITLYNGENALIYAVAEFSSKQAAKKAYDNLDGVELEKTGNVLNLSFIPDDFTLDKAVNECTSSKEFKGVQAVAKKEERDENMIEMSQEVDVDFEIPEEFRTKPKKQQVETVSKTVKPEESSSEHAVMEALREDVKEVNDFTFDPNDERFKELYEDEDFTLDASNKKFKQQKSSKDIAKKKFNQEEK